MFYSFQCYQIKIPTHNLTNKRNLTNDIPSYGNGFLTREPPRDYDLSFGAKL